jgi:hypothetical protein
MDKNCEGEVSLVEQFRLSNNDVVNEEKEDFDCSSEAWSCCAVVQPVKLQKK